MRVNNKIEYLVAVIYSIIYFFIPWERFRNSEFRDKEVYLDYVYYGNNILTYKSFDSFFSYITNEWLWHFILNNINFNPIYFFNIISLVTIFFMAYYLIKNIGYFSPLLLLNPLIIDMVFSQYRICLAFVFLLLSLYFKKNKLVSFSLILFSLLIHTSSIIFIFIFIFCFFLKKMHISNSYKTILLCCLGFIFSILFSNILLDFLEFIGDRRAEYNMERVSSSISYLSFWIFNFLLLLISCFKFNIRSLEQSVSLVILSLISMNSIIGGYSSRFLAVFFIVIWVSNFQLKQNYRFILLNIYFMYLIFQWYYWLGFN